MKKLTVFILLLSIAFSFAACGNGEAQDDSLATESSASNEISESSEPEAPLAGFALGHSLYTKAVADMMAAVGDSIEANNKSLEDEYPDSYLDRADYLSVYYSPFSSYRLLLLADLGLLDGVETVKRAYAIFGYTDISVSVTEGGYRLEYKHKKDGVEESCAEQISYAANGSFTMVCYSNGEEVDFIDLAVLGDGAFAIQNRTDRALLKYENGALVSLLHSETVNDYDYNADKYHDYSFFYSSADSIFGKSDIGADWVKAAGAQDKLHYLFDYSPDRLTVSGLDSAFNWETDSYDYTEMTPITITLG